MKSEQFEADWPEHPGLDTPTDYPALFAHDEALWRAEEIEQGLSPIQIEMRERIREQVRRLRYTDGPEAFEDIKTALKAWPTKLPSDPRLAALQAIVASEEEGHKLIAGMKLKMSQAGDSRRPTGARRTARTRTTANVPD